MGEVLLTPTKIYVKPVLAVLKRAKVHGISHITGGGFYENVPRCIPDGLCAKIEKAKINTPGIFKLIEKRGNIPERDMYNTFNMGVGMALIVSVDSYGEALKALKENGVDAYVIGSIVKGDERVVLC